MAILLLQLPDIVNWIQGHVLWVSVGCFIVGVALRKAGRVMARRERMAMVMAPGAQPLEGQYQELRVRLVQFRAEAGNLPALPERAVEYEGWFQDVKKRIEMRSEQRTLIEHIEMAKRFNELHSQWLQLAHTNYELSRVSARGTVEDAKIKLELKGIEVEMAKLDAQLRELREPKPAKPRQPADEERLRGVFHRVDNIATLNRIEKEQLARHEDDLVTQDIIRRIADDERQRILEGRR